MFERSDEKLIKQVLSGKKSAWICIVKRYEKQVYNYALRMINDPEDAQDLMQDVFVAVFKSLSSFKGDCPFKGWILKIAYYRCVEFYRRKKITQSLDDVPEQVEEDKQTCPEFKVVYQQQGSALNEAMAKLPVEQKVVVEMKFFQQATFEEIAFQLGISVNTAKSRLYSALDKLKGTLEHTLEVEYA